MVTTSAALAGEPVPFSHKRHAELKLECVYCHAKAVSGERAGFPAASKCMVCHREAAKDAEPIRRLSALAADTAIVPEKPLYTLPDFVFFSHARHKKECQACHGNVWAGDSVALQLQMKMKACIDCHKENHAVVTCTVCHELGQ